MQLLQFFVPGDQNARNSLLRKWEVGDGEDGEISVGVFVGSPVEDCDLPYVELFVPKLWVQRKRFMSELKRFKPPGFEHIDEYPEGEIEVTSSIWKYVPYESFIGSDGLFDGTGFIEGIREAAKTLVSLEKDMDGILADLI